MTEDLNDVKLTDALVITKRFRSPNEFALYIDEMVSRMQLSYMEAIVKYCTDVDIDIEAVSSLINPKLKEKIRLEAEENKLIKPIGRLPI